MPTYLSGAGAARATYKPEIHPIAIAAERLVETKVVGNLRFAQVPMQSQHSTALAVAIPIDDFIYL
ncbi:MAG: hypothetical protein Kow00121_55830 [Elainellaceae cyanobacterium]